MNFFILIFLEFSFSELVNVQPLSAGREYLASASLPSKGLAFFAGGSNEYQTFDNVDIFNAITNQWSTSALSIRRRLLAGTSLDSYGLIFFAGGCDINGLIHYDTVDIYDSQLKSWSVDKLSVKRNSLSATSLDNSGTVFFAGGANENGLLNTVDIYDVSNKKWTTSQLSIPRFNMASTNFMIQNLGIIFFGGGDNLIQVFNTIDIYIPSFGWGVLNLTTPRTHAAATVLPNRLEVYFAGGRDMNYQNLQTIEIYNIATQNFSIMYLSSPRRSLVATALPNLNIVFFAGGITLNQEMLEIASNKVDYIDWNRDQQNHFSMVFGREYFASASLYNNNLIVFAGGSSGQGKIFESFNDIFSGCNMNEFQTINPIICNNCSSGYYCPFGSIYQRVCPLGYFCPNSGNSQSTISPCPTGTYGSIQGLQYINQCTKCPAGYYNAYSAQTSAASCLPCSIGNYCPAGTSIPRECPDNHYCPSSTEVIPCPKGTFRENTDECINCQQGYFCQGNGYSPVPCSPGSYSNKNGSILCEICPEGYYCPFMTIEPIICPEQYYAPKGFTACAPCPSGQYTNGAGKSSCTVCVQSYWSINDWGCQTPYEKLISVFIWVGTVFSVVITIIKLRIIIKKRIKKLRIVELPITLKNIIFIDDKLKRGTYYLSMISQTDGHRNSFLQRNYDDEMLGLKQTILNLKMEIEDLK